jgi:hypothetical protein
MYDIKRHVERACSFQVTYTVPFNFQKYSLIVSLEAVYYPLLISAMRIFDDDLVCR